MIEFQSAAQASGIVTGHGEFTHPDGLIFGAYHWYDDYVKTDGRWVFARRDHKHMYALPVAAIVGVGRDTMRIRVPGSEPLEAEWLPCHIG